MINLEKSKVEWETERGVLVKRFQVNLYFIIMLRDDNNNVLVQELSSMDMSEYMARLNIQRELHYILEKNLGMQKSSTEMKLNAALVDLEKMQSEYDALNALISTYPKNVDVDLLHAVNRSNNFLRVLFREIFRDFWEFFWEETNFAFLQ